MLPRLFSDDHLELLEILNEHDVQFVLVGGIAVNYYGYSRSTGDIDLFFSEELGNTRRLYSALGEFFGDGVPGLDGPEDLQKPGLVIQFGLPPNRVDLINELSGVEFETVWKNRVRERVEDTDITVPIIGIEELLENKKASDRPKDEDDFQYLSDLRREGADDE